MGYAPRTQASHIIYITPALQEILGELSAREPRSTETGRVLTPRQREVLQLLAEGQTMKEAADILNVATRTVAFHKYRIMLLAAI